MSKQISILIKGNNHTTHLVLMDECMGFKKIGENGDSPSLTVMTYESLFELFKEEQKKYGEFVADEEINECDSISESEGIDDLTELVRVLNDMAHDDNDDADRGFLQIEIDDQDECR